MIDLGQRTTEVRVEGAESALRSCGVRQDTIAGAG